MVRHHWVTAARDTARARTRNTVIHRLKLEQGGGYVAVMHADRNVRNQVHSVTIAYGLLAALPPKPRCMHGFFLHAVNLSTLRGHLASRC
jgi:hypothetical protein